MSLFESFMALFAPHFCLGCGLEGNLLCDPCWRVLPLVPSRCYRCLGPSLAFGTCPPCCRVSSLRAVWVVADYEGPSKVLLHALKFARAQAAARAIAESIARRLPDESEWLVTHVPTATSRVRARGYDQAELIARRVARQRGLTYAPLLARSGQQRQLGQNRAVRRSQVTDRYRVARPALVRNRHILLIDDVLTTGATLESCAKTLRAAGAARVSAAVFAAAPLSSTETLVTVRG